MKILIVTAFVLCFQQGIRAQHLEKMENSVQDITAIRQALESCYFKGIYEGDVEILSKVFYPESLLFGDIKGEPYAKSLDGYLNGVKNRQSPKESATPFKAEIISLHTVNSIAVAEVNLQMYDFVYRDLLSFHKINGKWLIVNKMLTDIKQ